MSWNELPFQVNGSYADVLNVLIFGCKLIWEMYILQLKCSVARDWWLHHDLQGRWSATPYTRTSTSSILWHWEKGSWKEGWFGLQERIWGWLDFSDHHVYGFSRDFWRSNRCHRFLQISGAILSPKPYVFGYCIVFENSFRMNSRMCDAELILRVCQLLTTLF